MSSGCTPRYAGDPLPIVPGLGPVRSLAVTGTGQTIVYSLMEGAVVIAADRQGVSAAAPLLAAGGARSGALDVDESNAYFVKAAAFQKEIWRAALTDGGTALLLATVPPIETVTVLRRHGSHVYYVLAGKIARINVAGGATETLPLAGADAETLLAIDGATTIYAALVSRDTGKECLGTTFVRMRWQAGAAQNTGDGRD